MKQVEKVEIKFSLVGVTEKNQPRQMNYIPVVLVQYKGYKRIKKIFLEGMFDKKPSVKCSISGGSYIAVQFDNEYRIYDWEGKRKGGVLYSDFGRPIQVEPDCFVLLKEKNATWISDAGEVINSRELTEEELSLLKE